MSNSLKSNDLLLLNELEQLNKNVDAKIILGETLKQKLNYFKDIDGAIKIQRKINQEIKFLDKVKKSGQLKPAHVMCSNLVHYECLIKTLCKSKNIRFIDYPIPVSDRKSPLRIDIVCDNGSTWIKVIARNPKSLSDTAYGRSGYGAKTILDQAQEFIETANENQYFFKPPIVRFEFAHKIEDDLVNELQEIGVIINHVSDFDFINDSTIDSDGNTTISTTATGSTVNKNTNSPIPTIAETFNNYEAIKRVNVLNLDVTTMLAYVSAMTNGSSNWEYEEPILTEQASWERKNPVKRKLDEIFQGKQLICCETAAKSVSEISAMLGGPHEKIRSAEFMKRINVLPDVDIPDELARLNIGGKIKARSLIIFSFGIVHKALTVTANEGFIRSARMQGIDIPSFVHDARPLSEQKENKAKAIVNFD